MVRLRQALLPWVVSRAIVLVALGAVDQIRDHAPRVGGRLVTVGLTAWDGAFYRDIARHGYAAVEARDGLRFFPLYPLLARAFGGSDVALVVLANMAMLVALALVATIAADWCDERTAERVVWVIALGPGALASVMGYAEPLFLVAAAGTVLALQRNRVLVATGAGFAAALTRPVGVLLVVFVVVSAWERRQPRLALAAAGPVAGLVAYLAWVHDRTGDWLRPMRLQSRSNLRGETVDPVRAVWSALRDGIADHRVGPLVHVAWAVVAITLLAIGARRLPRAATAWAAVAVAVALTSRNLDSFERYVLVAFPVAVVAASVRVHRDVDRAALAILGGMLATYATLAFTLASIP